MKGHIIATAVAFVVFGLIALNQTRIEYAFDDFIGVINIKDCSYEQYKADMLSCVKDSYK